MVPDPISRPLIEGIGSAVQDLNFVAELLVEINDQSDSKAIQDLVLLALTRVEHAVSALNLEQIVEARNVPRPSRD